MSAKCELDKMLMMSEEKLENELSSENEEKTSCDGDGSSQAENIIIEQEPAKRKRLSKSEKHESKTQEKSRKSYTGKNSQCSICGKIVKGIQMHMLIHQGLKKHNCSYCSKSFTQSGQLKRHVNSHLNIRNYQCPEIGCTRTFVDPSSVTKHLVVHNKDDRKFQCSLCGSRFNRLGALRYHEKTHRQERNHTCTICHKAFLAKYDLTKHYRVHTGEKVQINYKLILNSISLKYFFSHTTVPFVIKDLVYRRMQKFTFVFTPKKNRKKNIFLRNIKLPNSNIFSDTVVNSVIFRLPTDQV